MQRRDFFKIGASFVIPAAWAQQASKSDWKPAVFDDHQNETVIALTELIIPATDTPGAKAARVNRYVDLFLRDGLPAQREAFLTGLNWLEGFAIREHGHPFVHCPAADQIAMLTAIEQGSGPGKKFFDQAKSLTARIYYNTEIGYRELNKGGRVPATFGCDHPSH
ncbi:MAG: gluconate 2-dehydrogenase subunit 3 family protein [Acidobacteriia bacterium]|nr:gluconate 2-dehydrogenase subunit 3 family protein [Terriglobia bacterium]